MFNLELWENPQVQLHHILLLISTLILAFYIVKQFLEIKLGIKNN